MPIKICGITNLEDARVAAEAGADWLGFVFYPKSPRYVQPEVAHEIIAKLPKRVLPVGLFVNADNDFIRHVVDFCQLGAVQYHGDESPAQLADLAHQTAMSNLQIFRAVALASADDLDGLDALADYTLIVDTPTPDYGGSGEVGDWSLAARVAGRYRTVLAGGLTPENVADAVATVRPWGVDVSSGVEASKGKKDPAKVRAFIANARQALTSSPPESRI